MKRLAFLSLAIATLIAPIQVQAQQYDPAGTASGSRRYLTQKQNCSICFLIRILVFVRHILICKDRGGLRSLVLGKVHALLPAKMQNPYR